MTPSRDLNLVILQKSLCSNMAVTLNITYLLIPIYLKLHNGPFSIQSKKYPNVPSYSQDLRHIRPQGNNENVCNKIEHVASFGNQAIFTIWPSFENFQKWMVIGGSYRGTKLDGLLKFLTILKIFGNTLKWNCSRWTARDRGIKINLIIQERVYCRQV